MCAEILAFPSTRRRGYVQKLAAQMCVNSPLAAERILRARLARHAETLARKGIRARSISSDVYAIETAARAEICRRNRIRTIVIAGRRLVPAHEVERLLSEGA
jgi:hypothetical protein